MGRSLGVIAVVAVLMVAQAARSRGDGPRQASKARTAPPSRYPWETPADARLRDRLARRVPSVRYDAVPFEEVMEHVRDLGRLNVVVHWPAMSFADVERDDPISLKLHDVSLGQLIRLILEQAGGGETELAADLRDGVLIISTREDLSIRTIRRVYDVDDLVYVREARVAEYVNRVFEAVAKYSGRDLSNDPETAARVVVAILSEQDEDPCELLIELIQMNVDPESWRMAGGNVGSIGVFGDRLVITQTALAHTQIVDLLADLRRPYADRPTIGPWR